MARKHFTPEQIIEIEAEKSKLQNEIEMHQEAIKKAEALERLYANKDFQNVISKGFFEDEALSTLAARALPQYTLEETKYLPLFEARLSCISELQSYFNQIEAIKRSAMQAVTLARIGLENIKTGVAEAAGEE